MPTGVLTWLTPYGALFQAAYGSWPSNAAFPQWAKALRNLEEQYGAPATQAAFGTYTRATPLRFFSVRRLADTFAFWLARTPTNAPPQPRTFKVVAARDGQRDRLLTVPLDDPRPEIS